MRLDKYLKVSRLIKRRSVANEACDGERVSVNGRQVKASYQVKVGDVIEIAFGQRTLKVEGTQVRPQLQAAACVVFCIYFSSRCRQLLPQFWQSPQQPPFFRLCRQASTASTAITSRIRMSGIFIAAASPHDRPQRPPPRPRRIAAAPRRRPSGRSPAPAGWWPPPPHRGCTAA